MNSLRYRKSQFKLLCHDIGFSHQKVKSVIDNIDNYYREKPELKVDKKKGDFKKYKDGTLKTRMIRESLKELKVIQRRIKDKILAPIPLPPNIHGGVKKRSNISNAKPHQGNKYQFTTDLTDFFPSIKYYRVFNTLLNLGFSNHYSHWLTKLITWKYELPQGSPTSTHVANLVFLEIDYCLVHFCNDNNITYTRFVDDLTFSSPKCFEFLLHQIIEIITKDDFKINYRKTSYKGNQNVTGIDVHNNFIDAPEKIKIKAKKEIETYQVIKPYTTYLNNIRKTNKKK